MECNICYETGKMFQLGCCKNKVWCNTCKQRYDKNTCPFCNQIMKTHQTIIITRDKKYLYGNIILEIHNYIFIKLN